MTDQVVVDGTPLCVWCEMGVVDDWAQTRDGRAIHGECQTEIADAFGIVRQEI